MPRSQGVFPDGATLDTGGSSGRYHVRGITDPKETAVDIAGWLQDWKGTAAPPMTLPVVPTPLISVLASKIGRHHRGPTGSLGDRIVEADRRGEGEGPVNGWELFVCALAGLAVTGLIVVITEYYTATEYRPVRSIAQSSTTGHGTNVIQGLAISMEATALPGHRRRLLEAIADLRRRAAPDGDAVCVSPALPSNPTERVDASESTAERRPLSVMFCDLVGSTALSSRLDPEDLREVIRTYQACVATTIRQYEGFIARYVGDGVLIYFGWPEARETDAERAVRAGLAVAATVGRAPIPGEELQVRIGIATGLVVIGEPIGSGDARQQTAIGETPNLAARLQGLAGPNQVVIDAATRRQIGGLFECQDLGTGRTQRSAGRGGGMASRVRKPHPRTVRGAAFWHNSAGRPRRRDRSTAPPLGPGEGRQWTGGADFRRAGRRQVPSG
jgi:class 3 adenylate cyclase